MECHNSMKRVRAGEEVEGMKSKSASNRSPRRQSAVQFCRHYCPPPLANRGSTCFAASFLQLLGAARAFIYKLFGIQPDFPLCTMFSVTPRQLCCGSAKDLEKSRRICIEHHRSVNNAFLTLLKGWTGSQHDSHEYGLSVLNWMRELKVDENPHAKSIARVTNSAFNLTLRVTRTCSKCAKVTHGKDEQQIFISLTLQQSLHDALKTYMVSHVNMRCDSENGGCGETTEHLWQMRPKGHLPRYLLIHIARFQWYPEPMKLNSPVKIPHKFAVGAVTYTLKGFVLHRGTSLDSGHFVSYVRPFGKNRWFMCNDHAVAAKTPIQMLRALPGAYLLMYSRSVESTAEPVTEPVASGPVALDPVALDPVASDPVSDKKSVATEA